MITIRKIDGGRCFDVPADLTLSLETNSPFFGTDGSYSLPVTLPSTYNNLSILGFPHRIDSAVLPSDVDVLVQNGIFAYSGNMTILSADVETGLECTILLESSSLRSKLSGKSLIDVCSDWVLHTADSVAALIDWIVEQTEPETDCDDERSGYSVHYLSCFPVKTETCVLNQQRVVSGSGNPPYFTLISRDTVITYDAGDYDIEYPVGCWCSPFLRVWKLIERLVEYCGLTISVEENYFRVNDWMCRLCVLNNSIDPCVTQNHSLYARHLVPDISVSDFLDELYKMFGVVLSVVGTEVKMFRITDMFDAVATKSLDSFIKGDVSVSIPRRRALEIKYSGNALVSEDCVDISESVESFQSLKKSKSGVENNIVRRLRSNFDDKGIAHTAEYNPDFYDLFQNTKMERFIGCLNWVPDDYPDDRESFSLVGSPYQMFAWDGFFSLDMLIPYIGEGLNKVIDISVTKDGEVIDCTLNQDCPLCFAFDNVGYKREGSTGRNYRYGSRILNTHSYDATWPTYTDGSPYYPGDSLSPDAFYYDSFEQYDNSLRRGMYEFTTALNLTPEELLHLSFFEPVVFRGRKCLLKQLKLELCENNIDVAEATFITL